MSGPRQARQGRSSAMQLTKTYAWRLPVFVSPVGRSLGGQLYAYLGESGGRDGIQERLRS